MKNIGQYNQDLSVPRKKDIDSLETRIKTNEDNIAMAESDIEGLTTDVGILKTDVTSVKTALNLKQDTIVGAASTIVENNLTADKVLVSDASGKVGVSDVTSTELNYLDGVTSNVQTQLDGKQGINDEIQAVRLRGGISSIINNASAVSINPAVNAIGFLLHNGGNVQIFYDGYLMPFQNQEIDTLFDGKSSTYINFGTGPRNAKNEGVCRWSETTQYPQNARVMYQTTSGVFRWYKALKESQGVIPEGDSTGAWEDVSISSSPNKMDVRNLDISIVIDSPSTFKYENGISLYWRALNQNCGYYKIEVYDSVQNQYALVAERDNIPHDEVVNTQYLRTKVNGDGKRARITLRSQPGQFGGWFAATQIALTGIGGGIEGTLVNRGGSTMYGNLSPYIDGGASLGTSSAQWEQVRAQNIYGNVNNTTSTFSQASSRTNISSGDKLSTIFGKIAKWFSDLGSLAFKSSVAKSDLANDVQTSLDKADSALQSAPVISVNSKTGAVTLGAVDIGALPLTGGTLSGNLNLNTNKLCLNEDGYQVSAPMGHLQIKKDTDLTPNGVAITEYNDNENKQLHFVVNDSSDGSHNTQAVLKKNTLQLYNNAVSGSSTTVGYVNVKGVADAIDDHDAVNLSQLNAVKSKIPSNIYNPNLLANWDLSNTINTTGITSWSLSGGSSMPVFNGYSFGGTPSDKPTVEIVSSYFVKLTNTVSSESRLWNNTSNAIIGPNKTYTFSVLVEPYGFTPNENTYIYVKGQVTSPEIKSSNYDNGLYMLTFATGYNIIPVTDFVGIALGSAGFMYIKGMKLEEGTNQTLCHKNYSGDWVVTDSFNPQIELAKISQWKKDVEYGADVWKYIGSPLLPLSGGTMTGPINMGNQKITRLADGTNDADAVNLGQLNKLAPKGIADITFGNIVLSSAIEVLHNTLFDCTYTGKIRSSTVIGGGASIPVSNTSYIVSVSGSDFGYSYGPCAVQKDKDSWNVTIRMLCTSRDAPNSITVPCLVW